MCNLLLCFYLAGEVEIQCVCPQSFFRDAHIYTCIYVHNICTQYMCTDTPTLTHKLYIHNSTHLYTCVYAHTHLCEHIVMCSHTIHMHACIHMYTHIHAHTQAHNLCRKSSTGYNTSKSPALVQTLDSYFKSLRHLVFPQAEKREVSSKVAGSALGGFD